MYIDLFINPHPQKHEKMKTTYNTYLALTSKPTNQEQSVFYKH
jgi:hypothetical protein